MTTTTQWRVGEAYKNTIDIREAAAPYGFIATVYGLGPKSESNARLIAAAPELLKALQDLTQRADTTEMSDGSSLDTAWAHALLARIEGTK